MAKKKKRKPAGWKVKRTKVNEATITLPEGMKFTSTNLDIEDIIEAVKRHAVLEKGDASGGGWNVVVKCCCGNTALA